MKVKIKSFDDWVKKRDKCRAIANRTKRRRIRKKRVKLLDLYCDRYLLNSILNWYD